MFFGVHRASLTNQLNFLRIIFGLESHLTLWISASICWVVEMGVVINFKMISKTSVKGSYYYHKTCEKTLDIWFHPAEKLKMELLHANSGGNNNTHGPNCPTDRSMCIIITYGLKKEI